MPFWLSVVVVAAGVIIRRTLDETPVFETTEAEGERREHAAGRAAPGPLAPGDAGRARRPRGRRSARMFSVCALSFATRTTADLSPTTGCCGSAILANVVALASDPAVGAGWRTGSGANRSSSRVPGQRIVFAVVPRGRSRVADYALVFDHRDPAVRRGLQHAERRVAGDLRRDDSRPDVRLTGMAAGHADRVRDRRRSPDHRGGTGRRRSGELGASSPSSASGLCIIAAVAVGHGPSETRRSPTSGPGRHSTTHAPHEHQDRGV